MRFIIDYEAERELQVKYEELSVLVGERVLDMEGCPYECQVNLVLTDDVRIREVNRQFRDLDQATDVLSFPGVPFENPADYELLKDDDTCFDLDTGELILGDIMISVDHVYAQAEEYGHSLEREFSFLIAHSMLHLLGYDHMTPEEADRMEEKQRSVLNSLGIHR
ncbi:MAG: rRNA maturation RNase YbeY [Blautia sp.]|nr:rRNA maturation RNase YbeY [Blautia sp.]